MKVTHTHDLFYLRASNFDLKDMVFLTIFSFVLLSCDVVSARQAHVTFQHDPISDTFLRQEIHDTDDNGLYIVRPNSHYSATSSTHVVKFDEFLHNRSDIFSFMNMKEELHFLRNDTNTFNPEPKQSSRCGVRNINGARIVGGTQTKFGEIPWRVAVFVYNKRTNGGGMCGGSIINRSWIMTAAHCTAGFRAGVHGIKVYVGAQSNPVTVGSGTSIISDRFVQHPFYNTRTIDNDISLVHLQTPLQYKSNVSPVCLPSGSLSRSEFRGAKVIASGWGTTKPIRGNQGNRESASKTLRVVELPLLTTAECRRYQRVTRNQICTYQPPKDACQGDSGGSIDYRHTNGLYYAVGIVSYGRGCGQNRFPGVYTKVNNYISWIESTTGDSF